MMTHAATFAVLLLSSLLVAKSDAATSCQAEFNQFKTCMGTAFNRVVQKADVDSKLAKVHVCFKNGNCKVSNQLTGGDSTKGATCNKSLFRQLGQSIDTCMKRKAPNFSYKEMMKKAPGSASYNFAEAKRKISKMVLLKQDVKSCPANTRQRVDNCRKPVAKQSTEDMKRYIDELCSAKNGCLAKYANNKIYLKTMGLFTFPVKFNVTVKLVNSSAEWIGSGFTFPEDHAITVIDFQD
ncbi:hypothetical protein D918_09266 [Trichuris suis]|nr:hypothetical protein D918_09266 [Trichuris suis]